MKRFASAVSWIGHPLVLVTAAVAIVVGTTLPSSAAFSVLAVLFLSVIAPVGLLLFLGFRSGRWRDADVSVRDERKRFYPIAIPLSAAGTIITWLMGAPRYILRGGLVTVAALMIAAVTNLWFKISLHALFSSYCAVVLFRVNVFCGCAFAVMAVLVFCSRLILARHTLMEMVSGAILGVVAGIVAGWT